MRRIAFRSEFESLDHRANPGMPWNPFDGLFSLFNLGHHAKPPVMVNKGPMVIDGTLTGHRASINMKALAASAPPSTSVTLTGRVSELGKARASYSETRDAGGHLLNGQIKLTSPAGRVTLAFTGQDLLSDVTSPTSTTTISHYKLAEASATFVQQTVIPGSTITIATTPATIPSRPATVVLSLDTPVVP